MSGKGRARQSRRKAPVHRERGGATSLERERRKVLLVPLTDTVHQVEQTCVKVTPGKRGEASSTAHTLQSVSCPNASLWTQRTDRWTGPGDPGAPCPQPSPTAPRWSLSPLFHSVRSKLESFAEIFITPIKRPPEKLVSHDDSAAPAREGRSQPPGCLVSGDGLSQPPGCLLSGDALSQTPGCLLSGEGRSQLPGCLMSGDALSQPPGCLVSGDALSQPPGCLVSGVRAGGSPGCLLSGDGLSQPPGCLLSGDALSQPPGCLSGEGRSQPPGCLMSGEALSQPPGCLLSGDALSQPPGCLMSGDALSQPPGCLVSVVRAGGSPVQVDELDMRRPSLQRCLSCPLLPVRRPLRRRSADPVESRVPGRTQRRHSLGSVEEYRSPISFTCLRKEKHPSLLWRNDGSDHDEKLPPCNPIRDPLLCGIEEPTPRGSAPDPALEDPAKGRKVSNIQIRKRARRTDGNVTPLGLPKRIRLHKEEFSLEEIYTNKNYHTPTEKRKFETIFEEPVRRGGVLVLTSQRPLRRIMVFKDGGATAPRKRRRRGKVPARGRRGTGTDVDVEVLLQQKMSQLEAALQEEDLDC